jgi:hypothetical protein
MASSSKKISQAELLDLLIPSGRRFVYHLFSIMEVGGTPSDSGDEGFSKGEYG